MYSMHVRLAYFNVASSMNVFPSALSPVSLKYCLFRNLRSISCPILSSYKKRKLDPNEKKGTDNQSRYKK